ncbi:hypothetical protein CPB86DRAFT_602239 [Serendipita vermifera]|nr:hypothetical protein CPB86DRAFT_602239 [Serendipita vermifera]
MLIFQQDPDVREEGKKRLRKEIWNGFRRLVGEEDENRAALARLKLRQSDMSEKTRSVLTSRIAKELEFYVFGLSSTTAGYEQRVDERIRGIRGAFLMDGDIDEDGRRPPPLSLVWQEGEEVLEENQDENLTLSREFVGVFVSVVSRWKGVKRL